MSVFAALALLAQGTRLTAGAGGAFPTIGGAVRGAHAGDTVRVAPGVYHEHLLIDRSITLLGEPGAVITGDGVGVVILVTAPAVILRGLTVRASGGDLAQEHAGIFAVDADSLIIEDNRLEDVLFGIYLKNSQAPVIRRNVIDGKNLAMPRRGDGIRLWYSHGGRITANEVRRTRDIVIWFSNGTVVADNAITEGRYGLHYMYSHHNRFEDNVFSGNEVGAFIMYSDDIVFRRNVFAEARGAMGRGLGFKDADRVVAERNILVKNSIGISIDNSPHSVDVTNYFRDNVIAYNDVAVQLLPSVRSNVFTGNQFLDNVQPVAVSGGGTALANQWSDNYWSEYAGFDADRDGHGDTPLVIERLSDDLLSKFPSLRVFNLSPAVAALNTLSRVFPLLTPEPILVDSMPRIQRATMAAEAARP